MCIYLLLAECEVRTARYGPSVFPSFYGPSTKRAGHENKEGKNKDPQPAVRTEQTRLIRCLLRLCYSGADGEKFRPNCSFSVKSMKFGTETVFKMTKKIGYGGKPEIAVLPS